MVRVPLLGRCEHLAEVIDRALDAVDLAFFRTLDDEHGTDHLIGGGDVEEHRLRFSWGHEDGRCR